MISLSPPTICNSAAKFNQKKAAELLGLTYHQLRALLKKHQI
ncbi:TPA: hypothetical protein N2P42_005808, partial [Klebsiella pneumoniae]|nr:hypothetical protein [Klebsiella pneumoniae]